MSTITKRYYTKTPSGRVLATSTERLVDDEAGRIHVSRQQTPLWCPGCNRPLSGFKDLRGTCDVCRRTSTCHTCESRCQMCAKRCCLNCRRGALAEGRMVNVCPSCSRLLQQRQAWSERIFREKLIFDRRLALRAMALRERTQHLRIAQLHVSRRTAWEKERRRRKQALIRARSHVQQLLR